MTNKEQIQQDLVVTFDFIQQIIDEPELIDKIPDGSAITFINDTNPKAEKPSEGITFKKYVKVKRHFEVL